MVAFPYQKCNLPHKTHPDIYVHFVEGNFSFKSQSADCRFSAIYIDQAHEQNNTLVKYEGGPIGLTENPALILEVDCCKSRNSKGYYRV